MSEKSLPAVDYLKIPDKGDPYLRVTNVETVEQFFLVKDQFVPNVLLETKKCQPLSFEETGVLHSFSVVYRSFPGIDVPYVSAIVDLDGGGTVKGNLINIEPGSRENRFWYESKIDISGCFRKQKIKKETPT